MSDDTVELEMTLHRETADAILVSDTGEAEKARLAFAEINRMADEAMTKDEANG